MNKNIFLVDLSKCLGFMTETEREEALKYYKELFDEAGAENEQKVLAQLGSPTKVAVELHRSYDRSHADTTGAERLLRGLFAENEAEPAVDEPAAEKTPIVETLPRIEEVLKEISASDASAEAEAAAEENPEAPEAEAEEVPAPTAPEAEAAPEEDAPSAAAEEEAPAAEETAAEEVAEKAPSAEEAPAEDKPEPVFVNVPVPAAAPSKTEEKPAPQEEPLEKKRGMPGWAIALILVLTCEIWLPIFAALLCVAIAIAVVPFALGVSLVAIAAYLVICAIWALGVITDALLMLAGAAIALAFGLVLTWLGIWAAIKLIALLCRGTAASYRGVFGRPKKERAK